MLLFLEFLDLFEDNFSLWKLQFPWRTFLEPTPEQLLRAVGEVASHLKRMEPEWYGVLGDITTLDLPFTISGIFYVSCRIRSHVYG